MKQSRFTGLLFCAAMVFFLTSCGGDGTKETTTDTATVETTEPSVTPQATNTIITTPQNMMVATHKVSDFAKWKASYEEHDSLRLANGIHSYVIGRGVDDPDMVLVAVKCDDMAKAKAFAKDPSLKKAMQKGGVTGAPSFSFATMTFQDTAVISPDIIRSRTTFTVKDWDAWQKAFEEGRQQRLDNGITVRAYGHDPDDNKKVVLVTALMDTAKAFAWYKSDELKKRREASGVIGEPKRFLFRVVQRY
jgi:heme-degrading monooxygenase HmoA